MRKTPAQSSVPVTHWFALGHNISCLLLPVFFGKLGASSALLLIPCELHGEANLNGICLQ